MGILTYSPEKRKPLPGTSIDRSRPLGQGIQAAWLLSEGAGVLVNDAAGGYLGTVSATSSAVWARGPRGPALALSGGSGTGVVAISNRFRLDTTRPWSVAANVLWTSDTKERAVWSFLTDQATGFVLYLSSTAAEEGVNWGSSANFVARRASGVTAASLNGVWKHLALVYDGRGRTNTAAYKLYIDGVPQSDTTTTAAPAVTANNLGTADNVSDTAFTGQLGDVIAWRRALSGDDVKRLISQPGLLFTQRPSLGVVLPARERENWFNVLEFGATGGGVTDDTIAIQRAINAAVYNAPATVVFPKGTYLVQDPTTGTHPFATDGPIRIPPTARNVTLRGEGGVIKIGTNGVGTAAVRLFGSDCRLIGLVVDCNTGVAPNGKDNSGIEVNGSDGPHGGVAGVTGCRNLVENCTVFNGHRADADVDQGQSCFASIGGSYNVFRDCLARDAGWQGFVLAGGNGNRVEGGWATNHRGNGVRVQGEMEEIHIVGFTSHSEINSGRASILIDPAASASLNRCRRAFISGCTLYSNPTVSGTVSPDPGGDGSSNTLKLASCDEVFVDQCSVRTGEGLDNCAIRLEDSLGRVVLTNTSFKGSIGFAPAAPTGSSVFSGQPTAHQSDGGTPAKVKFTLPSGHGLLQGKSLFVKNSGIPRYDREHVIQTVSGSIVTTDVDFVSGILDTANIWAHSGVRELVMRNVRIEHNRTTGGWYHMQNLSAVNILDLQNVRFFQTALATAKQGAIFWDVAEKCYDLLRLVDIEAVFNSSNAFTKFLRPGDQGVVEVQTFTILATTTGGTFTITDPDTSQTTGALGFNATNTDVQSALRALTGLAQVTVSKIGGPLPGTAAEYTINFHGVRGNKPLLTYNSSLTGGAISRATVTEGIASQQLLTSGKTICYRVRVRNLNSRGAILVDVNGPSDVGTNVYPTRTLLCTSDGDRVGSYLGTAAPTATDVTFKVGDHIRHSNPSVGGPPGWVYAGNGAPSWRAEPNL